MTFHRIVPAQYVLQARYRRRQQQKGLCICCPKKAVKNRRRCKEHLQAQRETEQKRRDRLREGR